MNMSLGGSLSRAVNRAIQALNTAGVVPVVAAGNENVCNCSTALVESSSLTKWSNSKMLPTLLPAQRPWPSLSVPLTPITTPRLASPTLVRQSTSLLRESKSSASVSDPIPTPTSSVELAWVSIPTQKNEIYMIVNVPLIHKFSACPHVAGLAAYLMSIQGANSAEQVDSLMKNLATQTGASVRNNVPGTTNLIANNGNQ